MARRSPRARVAGRVELMSLDIYFYEPENCPHCGKAISRGETCWEANITHNLNRMAGEAGIYKILWRADEQGITTAKDLTRPITDAITLMESDPERFRPFDAKNGWGTYEHFVPWLKELRDASIKYPDATVEVSR